MHTKLVGFSLVLKIRMLLFYFSVIIVHKLHTLSTLTIITTEGDNRRGDLRKKVTSNGVCVNELSKAILGARIY